MCIYTTEFRPTYLYIKQHRITGKLYLGKTSGTEQYLLEQYNGSGKHWSRHIKKHGIEYVDTIWYCLYYDKDELVKFALMCSEQWGIVDSDDWLNIKPENGLDGGFDYINNNGLNGSSVTSKPGDMKFVTMLRERKLGRFDSAKQSKWGKLGGKAATDIARKNGTGFFALKGTKRTASSISNQKKTFKEIGHSQGKKNSQFGTCWVNLPWGEISRRIKLDKIEDYISQGWVKGMSKKQFTSNSLL